MRQHYRYVVSQVMPQAMAKRKSRKGYTKTYPSLATKEQITGMLTSIEDGESIEVVAKNNNYTRSGLYKHLNTQYPEEYKASMDARADHLADRMLEIASDEEVDVARARNMINSIQFTLSRRHSNLYGDKVQQEVTLKNQQVRPIINITLSAPQSTVAIETAPIDVTPLPDTKKAIQDNE